MAGEEQFHNDGLDRGVSPDVAEHLDAVVPDGRTPGRHGPTVDVVARFQQQKEAERAAADRARFEAMSPADQRIATLRKKPAFLDTKHADHAKVMSEYRRAVDQAATPEETAAIEAGTLEEARAFYNVAPPGMPPSVLENYNENFSDWERDALVAFRQEGFDTALATGLRDAGIRLAMMVDGKPLADEVIDAELKKFPSLTASHRANLKAYWRRIEGGA